MTSNVYMILYPPVQPVIAAASEQPAGEEIARKDHDTQRHGGHDTQRHDGAAEDGEIEAPLMTPSVAPLMTLGDDPHDTQCRNNYPTGTNQLNEPFARASAPSAPHAGKASEFYVQHAARDGLTPDQIQRSFDQLHADLMHQGMRAEQATAIIANLSMFYRPQPKGLAIIRREAVKRAGDASVILGSHQR